MFSSIHGSYGGRVQKRSGGGKQDSFHCWQKSKAYHEVFGDEDDDWVQIGNKGDKSNSNFET